MRRPDMRVLDVSGSPEAIGAGHGATYRDEIRAYTAERVALAASPTGRETGPTAQPSPKPTFLIWPTPWWRPTRRIPRP